MDKDPTAKIEILFHKNKSDEKTDNHNHFDSDIVESLIFIL